MLILVIQLLFSYLVSACGDCFPNCSDLNKEECLSTCYSPIFTSTGVKGGEFIGVAGKIYVPNVKQNQVEWVEASMNCNLSCTEQCSLKCIGVDLELCVISCGCQELLKSEPLSKEESIHASCSDLCKGSGSGCYSNCLSHFQIGDSNWYLWLWLPVVLVILLAVFIIIKKQKKEDDYILM